MNQGSPSEAGPAIHFGRPTAPDALAWVDARVGVAGDMLLAALVDAGADAEAVAEAVAAATGGRVGVDFEPVHRAGLAALSARLSGTIDQHHRRLPELLDLVDRAGLDPAVAKAAVEVFTAIGEVEAAVHGVPLEQVHFHEVGALDTVADVVGTLAAWHSLECPQVVSSVVGVGSGMVAGSHGELSVPAPAVSGLLGRAGAPSWAGPLPREAATPTGVALLCVLSAGWGDQPAMVVQREGRGAGTADPAGIANVTRVLIGRRSVDSTAAGVEPVQTRDDDVLEVRCNVDDLDPRVWPSVVAALLDAGALDAWLQPITMKGGRPAILLSALLRRSSFDAVTSEIFRSTPTFGVRWHRVDREELDRAFVRVQVAGCDVSVKVGSRGGEVITAQPEWRDVQHAAAQSGLPTREVLRLAQLAANTVTPPM